MPGSVGDSSRRPRQRAWATLRLPLAAACFAAGLVCIGFPVWSGWWNAHLQAEAARSFDPRLPRTAPVPPPYRIPPASPQSAPTASVPATPEAESRLPAGGVLAELRIPAIGVDALVLQGLTYNPGVWTRLLRAGPAHLEASALPGQPGNVVIFGHLNIWGGVFLHLDRLRPHDLITLRTNSGRFVYSVTGSRPVAPTDLAYVAPRAGAPRLQLVTCTGAFDQLRLVVNARLVSGSGAGS